jgi:hypothetical protein
VNCSAALDRLPGLFLSDIHPSFALNVAIALRSQLGHHRQEWRPVLSNEQLQRLESIAWRPDGPVESDHSLALMMIGFHAENWLSDDEVAVRLAAATLDVAPRPWQRQFKSRLDRMLAETGEKGRKHLQLEKRRRQLKKERRKKAAVVAGT